MPASGVAHLLVKAHAERRMAYGRRGFTEHCARNLCCASRARGYGRKFQRLPLKRVLRELALRRTAPVVMVDGAKQSLWIDWIHFAVDRTVGRLIVTVACGRAWV
jgi:hypothetical protein